MSTLEVAAPAARPPDAIPSRKPNQLAQQITGRSYISYSQIALMRSCPRKFAFQYVENARPDFIPVSLILGGSIHGSLDVYFRSRMEGQTITAEAMLSAYHKAWREQRHKAGEDVPVRFNKKDDETKLHALAERIINVFLASPLASPKGIILGIEEERRIILDPELPDVLAKVDLVTQTEGHLHVVDWKTSRSRWTEQKAQESGEQLLLYGAAVTPMSRALGLGLKLHFAIITKAKSPQVQLLPVPSDQPRLDLLTETVGQVWQAIQSGNFYPAPSPQNCTTCPFRSRCPVFASA